MSLSLRTSGILSPHFTLAVNQNHCTLAKVRYGNSTLLTCEKKGLFQHTSILCKQKHCTLAKVRHQTKTLLTCEKGLRYHFPLYFFNTLHFRVNKNVALWPKCDLQVASSPNSNLVVEPIHKPSGRVLNRDSRCSLSKFQHQRVYVGVETVGEHSYHRYIPTIDIKSR